jgi:hypothetical protein
MQKIYNLWTTSIEVFDDFITNQSVIQQLQKESFINTTILGQNTFGLTDAQMQLYKAVSMVVMNYCVNNNIDYSNLKFGNLQKGCLHKYDESMVSNHLYEPHNDMVEGSFITAIYYVDSAYEDGNWCGGELTLYKHLTFADYPQNIINILPKLNRLIIFPGFTTHRVKPYFGNKPRTSLVFGWSVDEPKQVKVLTI